MNDPKRPDHYECTACDWTGTLEAARAHFTETQHQIHEWRNGERLPFRAVAPSTLDDEPPSDA